jgi:hypothetical protein
MKLYTIRKRRGQWAVCSDDNVVLHFNSYDEAIGTVRSAVRVLANRPSVSEIALAGPGDGNAVPCPSPSTGSLPYGDFPRRLVS